MPTELRFFISSPGDVPDERLRADLIIDKLAQEFRRYFVLTPYRWEYEPMLASGTFQDAIEPPRNFDVVLLIVWSRLGTPLPEKTALREYKGMDGRSPVTGTEWEFEDALQAAEKSGKPDVLVFRNISQAPIDTRNTDKQAKSIAQLQALNEFWKRHRFDAEVNCRAYEEYSTLEKFAKQFETKLRNLLRQKKEKAQLAADVLAEPPYRGLEAYEFEHASIYFGRDMVITAAIEQLASRDRAGTAFLLVSGASGSGKSSLVKAGLLPRLMKPQRIPGTEFLRRAIFRPADMREHPATRKDLFLAFVNALIKTQSDPRVGLPELLGPGQTVTTFTEHLRGAIEAPGYAFQHALGELTKSERAHGRLLAYEQDKLIILIDQLEELFTIEEITPDDRKNFIRLIGGLARSGVVWVVATMRADFWYRAATMPDLIALTAGEGRIDVPPASSIDIAEIIKEPAEAAGLEFEPGLDKVLAEEAVGEPGALPLLSFTLNALYQEDVEKKGAEAAAKAEAERDLKNAPARMLTYATYKQLGGLKGAIAKRADEVLSHLDETARKAVPRVLRALTTIGSIEQVPVARAAPREGFLANEQARAVIAELDRARLLVGGSDGEGATVRVAHEALLSHWQFAREQLAADRRDLQTRAVVERQQTRWSAAPGGRAKRQLLLRDPDLASAVDLAKRWGDELTQSIRDFINRSAFAAFLRRWTVVAVVLLVVLGIAGGSLFALEVTQVQRAEALAAQSRFLARDSRTAVADGNVTLANLLALFSLPRDVADPDRPFVREAEYALENATANRRERAILHGHQGTIWHVAFSPDNSRIVTASDDHTARLWDVATGALVKTLDGHAGPIWFAAFSPKGDRIVTASADQTARLWDADGKLIAVLSGHGEGITFAAFSPDGNVVATASDDGTARLWNADGSARVVLTGHGGPVNSVAFAPDGKAVVTSSTDATARLWDLSGGPGAVLRGHEGPVWSASFSPDGATIITASSDFTARTWSRATGAVAQVLHGHVDRIWSAQFSPDGKRAVTASQDQTARLWDVATGEEIGILKGHEDWVTSAVFTPDGLHIVTASNDQTARIWDGVTGLPIAVLRAHSGPVTDAAFSPDGRLVATTSRDLSARIWSAETDAAVDVLRGHGGRVFGVAFSPDGKRIISASEDKTARIWDAASGREIAKIDKPDVKVTAAAYAPNGKLLVTTGWDNAAWIWDAATLDPIVALKGGHVDVVMSAAFSPDSTRVVTASRDGTARVWEVQTGASIAILRGHENWVTDAVFMPDGKRVVTVSWDNTMRVWDAASGKELQKVHAHDGRLTSVAVSPDGLRLVTGSWDDTGKIWQAETLAPAAELRGHDNWVTSVAFSADGKRIITGSADTTAEVWDAETGAPIVALHGHSRFVTFAAFSPDGQRVVTASYDMTVRLWQMPPHCQRLIALDTSSVLREPTAREADKYYMHGRPTGSAVLQFLTHWLSPLFPQFEQSCD
jgi:WD40 repeat protein